MLGSNDIGIYKGPLTLDAMQASSNPDWLWNGYGVKSIQPFKAKMRLPSFPLQRGPPALFFLTTFQSLNAVFFQNGPTHKCTWIEIHNYSEKSHLCWTSSEALTSRVDPKVTLMTREASLGDSPCSLSFFQVVDYIPSEISLEK